MAIKKLLATADRAVWGGVTKGRAVIRWHSVVQKVWKGVGGNHGERLSIENFERYKIEVEEGAERRGRLMLRNKVKAEKRLAEVYGGLRENI